MKCEQFERKILSAESGELPEREVRALEKHLSVCARCLEYREDARRIVLVARNALARGEPSAGVLARIKAAAEKKARKRTVFFMRPALQTLACAAALAVLTGAWFILARDDRSERISEMNAILAMMTETEAPEQEIPTGRTKHGDEGLRTLASRLLLMESPARDEPGDEELLFPQAGLRPTGLRSRSIAGFQLKKCV